jgi:hypothetical protein
VAVAGVAVAWLDRGGACGHFGTKFVIRVAVLRELETIYQNGSGWVAVAIIKSGSGWVAVAVTVAGWQWYGWIEESRAVILVLVTWSGWQY